MKGTPHINSFEFKPYNMSSFNFVVNNNSYPKIPYKMKWDVNEKSFSRIFHNCYSSLALHNLNESVLLNMENFEKSFFIIEDISTSMHALTSLSSELEFAHVGVDINFHAPLKESLTFLLYCLVPAKFKIDHNRQCEIIY